MSPTTLPKLGNQYIALLSLLDYENNPPLPGAPAFQRSLEAAKAVTALILALQKLPSSPNTKPLNAARFLSHRLAADLPSIHPVDRRKRIQIIRMAIARSHTLGLYLSRLQQVGISPLDDYPRITSVRLRNLAISNARRSRHAPSATTIAESYTRSLR